MLKRQNPLNPLLKNPSFRIYFLTALLSNIGNFMHSLAMSWLVYRVTGSIANVGLLTLAEQLPAFFLSPYAGIYCERHSIRKIVTLTQSLLCVFVGIIAASFFFKLNLRFEQLFAVSLCIGVVNGFDIIARANVLTIISKPSEIPNVVALNSFLLNFSRIIGPVIAGIAIQFAGEPICFTLNALSFIPFIIGLQFYRYLPHLKQPTHNKSYVIEILDNAKYALEHIPIKKTLQLVYSSCFFSFSFMVLMPAFVREIHHGDSRLLGNFNGMIGLGAVTGALLLASRISSVGIQRTIASSYVLFAISGLLFGLTNQRTVAYFALTMIGFFMVYHMSSSNAFIQTQSNHKMRARITSLYSMAHTGVYPIGAVVVGKLADHFGCTPVVLGYSAVSFLFSAYFYLQVRHWENKIDYPEYEVTTSDGSPQVLTANVFMKKAK